MEVPDVTLCRARARDPAWLLALSGSDTAGGNHAARAVGGLWCSLCLRAEGDDQGAGQDLAGAPRCCAGTHAFCRRCFDVCGGQLLAGKFSP